LGNFELIKNSFLFKLNLDGKDNTKSRETVVKELKMFIKRFGNGNGRVVMGY
jgi:hypothetical protein